MGQANDRKSHIRLLSAHEVVLKREADMLQTPGAFLLSTGDFYTWLT